VPSRRRESRLLNTGSTFTGVFQQVADGRIGSVEELPGANTQGGAVEETRENLNEAIRLVLEANCELAKRETQGCDVVRESIPVSP
jgi:predicted RNase H-like HicB family nuclease